MKETFYCVYLIGYRWLNKYYLGNNFSFECMICTVTKRDADVCYRARMWDSLMGEYRGELISPNKVVVIDSWTPVGYFV